MYTLDKSIAFPYVSTALANTDSRTITEKTVNIKQEFYSVNDAPSPLQNQTFCKLLDVDVDALNNAHDRDQKMDYLKNCYLRAEFAIAAASNRLLNELEKKGLDHESNEYINKNTIISSNTKNLFDIIDNVYDQLNKQLNKQLNHEQLNRRVKHAASFRFSPASVGLKMLQTCSTYGALESDAKKPLAEKGLVSVVRLTEKKGVEPGFIGFFVKDVLYKLDEKTASNREEKIKLIQECNNDIEKLYQEYFSKEIQRVVIKLVYTKSDGDKLIPDDDNLKRSKTFQQYVETGGWIGSLVGMEDTAKHYTEETVLKLFKNSKTAPRNVKNKEAIQELLANDDVRELNVPAQNLYLLHTEINGKLQFYLASKFIEGAKELVPLGGGLPESNQNYIIREVICKTGQIKAVVDPIAHLSEHYLPTLSQLDRDGVGSAGQNNMYVGEGIYFTYPGPDGNERTVTNSLVTIDTGKAASKSVEETKKDIKNNLTDYLHYNDEKFLNYSVFLDAELPTFMKGLLIMLKKRGESVSDDIIQSYNDPAFTEAMKNTQGPSKLRDDYKKEIETLQKRYEKEKEVLDQQLAKQKETLNKKNVNFNEKILEAQKAISTLQTQKPTTKDKKEVEEYKQHNKQEIDRHKNIIETYKQGIEVNKQEIEKHTQRHAERISQINNNIKDCIDISKHIDESVNRLDAGKEATLKKLAKYTKLPMHAIRLKENLEKYGAGSKNTSLLSPDQTVIMQHLRITNIDKTNRPLVDVDIKNGQVNFKLQNFSNAHIAEIQSKLREVTQNSVTYTPNPKSEKLGILSFNQEYLAAASDVLNEKFIMKKYHPDEYKLAKRYYRGEVRIPALAALFKELGMNLTLTSPAPTVYMFQIDVINSHLPVESAQANDRLKKITNALNSSTESKNRDFVLVNNSCTKQVVFEDMPDFVDVLDDIAHQLLNESKRQLIEKQSQEPPQPLQEPSALQSVSMFSSSSLNPNTTIQAPLPTIEKLFTDLTKFVDEVYNLIDAQLVNNDDPHLRKNYQHISDIFERFHQALLDREIEPIPNDKMNKYIHEIRTAHTFLDELNSKTKDDNLNEIVMKISKIIMNSKEISNRLESKKQEKMPHKI